MLKHNIARFILSFNLIVTFLIFLGSLYEPATLVWGALCLIPFLLIGVLYGIGVVIYHKNDQTYEFTIFIVLNSMALLCAVLFVYFYYRDFAVNGFGLM